MLSSSLALLAGAAAAAATATEAAAATFGHALRPLFFFNDNFTQLNHGAYGGTPRAVVDAQYAFVAEMEADLEPWMNSAGGYRRCILAAREQLAAMVNAPSVNDTVLVDNASEAINDVLRNFEPPLTADEYIVELSTAYGPFTGLYEWLGIRQGVQLLTVPIAWPVTGPESFLAPVAAMLAANASSLNLRVAVISQISAYPAVLLPVKELVELFHRYNVPVVVDGAHALGNINVDLAEMGDPDYALWNLHKWYFAPKSAALLYVRRDHQLLHVPAPSVVDNTMTDAFPDRFVWTGTRDRTPYCAILNASDFRASIGGEQAIQQYNRGLALYAKRTLEKLWQVPEMAPESMIAGAMALVKIPTDNATVCGIVAGRLRGDFNLGVSGWAAVPGFPCSFRISAQVYLETSDIDRLGSAVMAIIASEEEEEKARAAEDSFSLGVGTNLGNTLEAPLEGQWAPSAQEFFFDDFKTARFSTVRIPVRWDNHTMTEPPFTINATWMARVQTVVSWCTSRGFFCIINSHWDSWLDTNSTSAFAAALPRFAAIWQQVASAFVDAPATLLFESFNEPHVVDTPKLNALLTAFYEAVRPLHPTRRLILGWLNYMGPSWIEEGNRTNWDAMVIPTLPSGAPDLNLAVECHSYDPYDVCGHPTRPWGSKSSDFLNMDFMFKTLSNWSATHSNIPVFMGESGCIRTQNQTSRVEWYGAFFQHVQQTPGIAGGLVWDDDGGFRVYNRSSRAFDVDVLRAIGL
jgi:selenocysteine lyase/cysteine desulfurase